MIRRNRLIFSFFLTALLTSSFYAQSGSDTDFLYARKLFEDKMYPLSAQEFTRFIRTYPSDSRLPDARYYAGMSYFYQKQYELARREFQFLAIDYPKDKRASDAWQLVAQCYSELGDYIAAANALSSLAAFYPSSSIALKSQLDASDLYV
jgi:TolA-binding protein